MSLLVHTSEISVDFVGFKLDVTSPPDCSYLDCGTTTITIDATEAQNGAVDQRLSLRCRTSALARVLREALMYVEAQD